MKKFIPVLLLVCSISFLASCAKEKNIDKDVMVKAYVDLLISEEINSRNPEEFQKGKEDVFLKHGITEEDYTRTLESFEADKEVWDEFFELSFAYLDTLRTAEKPK